MIGDYRIKETYGGFYVQRQFSVLNVRLFRKNIRTVEWRTCDENGNDPYCGGTVAGWLEMGRPIPDSHKACATLQEARDLVRRFRHNETLPKYHTAD